MSTLVEKKVQESRVMHRIEMTTYDLINILKEKGIHVPNDANIYLSNSLKTISVSWALTVARTEHEVKHTVGE